MWPCKGNHGRALCALPTESCQERLGRCKGAVGSFGRFVPRLWGWFSGRGVRMRKHEGRGRFVRQNVLRRPQTVPLARFCELGTRGMSLIAGRRKHAALVAANNACARSTHTASHRWSKLGVSARSLCNPFRTAGKRAAVLTGNLRAFCCYLP